MKPTEYGFFGVLILLAMGALVYYDTQSFMMIAIASGIGTAYAIFLTLQQLMGTHVNVMRFVVYQNIIWYCFPLTYFDLIDQGGLLDVSRDDMVASLIVITGALSIGWVMSIFIDMNIEFSHKDERRLGNSEVLAIILPICLLQVAMIATGHWSYAANHVEFGVSSNEENHNPITLLLRSVAGGVAPVAALYYGLLPIGKRTLFQNSLFLGVIGLQCGFWFIDSRRNLMVITAFSAIVLIKAVTKGKIAPRQIIRFGMIGLVLGLGLIQAGKAFYSIRMAYDVLGHEQAQNVSFLTLIETANNLPAEQIEAELDRNKAARPYIISSIGTFLRTSSGFQYGEGVINELVSLIPSVLFPGKMAYLEDHPVHEALWNLRLGVPLSDYANSFVLDGYADFGYFGFAIYTLGSFLCLRFVAFLYSLFGSRALRLFCIYNFIFHYFQVENELGTFIVITRDLILYLLLICPYFLYYHFPFKFRARSAGTLKSSA